jgi:hypothetical protein
MGRGVKLVGAEGRGAGLDATIAKGREIESKVDGDTADVVGGLQHPRQ